jgi:hypothetical protein
MIGHRPAVTAGDLHNVGKSLFFTTPRPTGPRTLRFSWEAVFYRTEYCASVHGALAIVYWPYTITPCAILLNHSSQSASVDGK